MQVTAQDPTKGILDFPTALSRFMLQRLAPAQALRCWIDSYWIVSWELPPGETHRQSNVSHASMNVALEPEGAFLYGVPNRVFVRELTGSGRVFGIKFRPGGFYPFRRMTLKGLAGKKLPLDAVFGDLACQWASEMVSAPNDDARARITDRFWQLLRERSHAEWGGRDRLPSAGPTEATLAAERIISDRSLRTVTDAARTLSMDVRGLQRLFQREVGISPKELILRFRLQEAAERLLRQPDLRSSDLALDLGYFDQAHFIRDFKSVTGVSPEAYQQRQPRR